MTTTTTANISIIEDVMLTLKDLVSNNTTAQYEFIDKGVCDCLLTLLSKGRTKEVEIYIADIIYHLAKDNPASQKAILDMQLDAFLLQLFTRGRSEKLQEKTANCLWAVAGNSIYVQRKIAEQMGVSLLLGFVRSLKPTLHYIGSEALSVLARGPISFRNDIAPHGTQTLVQLLRETIREDVILSVIRTLRHLCVAIGFVAYPVNQQLLASTNGIKYLLHLTVHSANLHIQTEAALSLAYTALGNPTNLETIKNFPGFSYCSLLSLLHSSTEADDVVQLTAGMALATFAYNCTSQQKEMLELGGVQLKSFVHFLDGSDEYFACCAAFQVVILSRVITDEDQAVTSALGIRRLVHLLKNSDNEVVLTLAADCVARLTHTRAGVPQALIAIDVVQYLCEMLQLAGHWVQGAASIALTYLTAYHAAERQLLHRCRTKPHLMQVLQTYSQDRKLPASFMENWRHFKTLGLPNSRRSARSKKQQQHQQHQQQQQQQLMASEEDMNSRVSIGNLTGVTGSGGVARGGGGGGGGGGGIKLE